MGILSNWGGSGKQWTTTQPQCKRNHSNCNSSSRDHKRRRHRYRSPYEFIRLIKHGNYGRIHTIGSRWVISVYPELFWTRNDEPNDNTKGHHYPKRHRHNKYLYSIKKYASSLILGSFSLLVGSPTLAQGVGGVSATANPIANSSGSVTNQAIQVLQGPYITNTYGNQISCQGATFNATPYIQYSNSYKEPWEDYYLEPRYNQTDFTGRTTQQTVTVKNYPWENWYDTRTYVNDDGETTRWFEDGADMQIEIDVDGPDGIPDNPGEVIWEEPIRTDMKSNSNLNIGISATISWPLDGKLQELCKEAARTQIEQQKQLTANKRLDFEIARLKNCGELKQKGIMFHPASPYYSICSDVVVTNPGGKLVPHNHTLPQPTFSKPSSTPLQPDSVPAEPKPDPVEKAQVPSSPSKPSPFRWPFSRQASQPSEAGQPVVSPEELKSWQLQQSSPWLSQPQD